MVLAKERPIRNVFIACFSFFLLCLSAYVIMPLIPLYIENRASMVNIAWITVGASVLGVIPASIIGGRISDYIGPKITIAIALLIFGFSKFLFPFAATLTLLFALRAIGGLYAAAFPAVQSVLINEAGNPQERTKFLSYYGFSFGAGLAIGPVAGGFIGQYWGLAEAFNVTFYLSLMGAFIILFMKEKKIEKRKQKLLVFSKNPVFWRAALSAFLCMGTMGTLLTLIPIMARHNFNFTNWHIGLSMALLTGCFAVWQLFLGRFLKPESLTATIQYGFVIVIAGLLTLYFFNSFVGALILGLALAGIGLGTAYVAATSMAAGTTTLENRGGIMGFFTAAMNLGYGFLAVTIIYLSSLWVQRAAFLILAVIALFVIAILFYDRLAMQQKRRVNV